MGGVAVAALFIIMATMIYSQWIRAIHAEKRVEELEAELSAERQGKLNLVQANLKPSRA